MKLNIFVIAYLVTTMNVYADGWLDNLSCNTSDVEKRAIVETESKKAVNYFINEITEKIIPISKETPLMLPGSTPFDDDKELDLGELLKSFKGLVAEDWNSGNEMEFEKKYHSFWKSTEIYLEARNILDKRKNRYDDLRLIDKDQRPTTKIDSFTTINNYGYIIPYIEEIDKDKKSPITFSSMKKWLGTGLYFSEIVNEGALLNHTRFENFYLSPVTFLTHDINHSLNLSRKLENSDPKLKPGSVCEKVQKCFKILNPTTKLDKLALFFLVNEIEGGLSLYDAKNDFLDEHRLKNGHCRENGRSPLCPMYKIEEFIYDMNVDSFIKENRDLYKKVCMNRFNHEETEENDETSVFWNSLGERFSQDKEMLSYLFSKKVCLSIENDPENSKTAHKKEAVLNQVPEELVNGIQALINSQKSKVGDLSKAINPMAKKLGLIPYCRMFISGGVTIPRKNSQKSTCDYTGEFEDILVETKAIRDLNEQLIGVLDKINANDE